MIALIASLFTYTWFKVGLVVLAGFGLIMIFLVIFALCQAAGHVYPSDTPWKR